jgi:hypothetical protein
MFVRSCAAVVFCLAAVVPLSAVAQGQDPSPQEIQKIIKTFIQKEIEFAAARESYEYRQTTKLTEVDPPGGGFEIVEQVTFDDRNRRVSKVLRAPVASLQNIVMTAEDEQDYRNIMPFAITADSADAYDIKYLRREKVDEISCYVFSIKPKELTKDRKRYFEGDVWVDDQDYQIVKTYGRSAGYLGKNNHQAFPKFETYREQIDGKYWFPTYTYADDTLKFDDGQTQRIKQVIKYDHYKKFQFKSESTIQYGSVDGSAPPPPPPASNPPAKTPPK